jgi:pimeloyl-ACP methyl ester carboxylesterase
MNMSMPESLLRPSPVGQANFRSGLARANGIDIYYEDRGPLDAPPLLLVMGLGAQHVCWPRPVLDGLLQRGYRVVTFDNRDIGLSSKIDTDAHDSLPAAYLKYTLKQRIHAPYTLYDMADDTVGLLDALDIESAHLVGVSMGGMIAQVAAALHRDRVRSLTSVMSSTLHPRLPGPRLNILMHMGVRSRGGITGREQYVRQTVRIYRAIHGKGFPFNEQHVRDMAGQAYDRCFHPAGFERQAVGIFATGCFEPLLRRVTAPALVIHGDQDPLVHVEGGRATARAIRGARLEIIRGMGHGMAEPVVPHLLDWTHELARRA